MTLAVVRTGCLTLDYQINYYVCKVYDWIISFLCRFRQQVDDWCLTPRDQFVIYIMARSKYIQWNDDDVSFVLDQHTLVWPDRVSHSQTTNSRWARQQLNHWCCSLSSDTYISVLDNRQMLTYKVHKSTNSVHCRFKQRYSINLFSII
jgi:hypothetical protein